MDNQTLVSSASVAVYILIAFLAGGGTVVAAVALLANQILKSPVLITALENLAQGASPELLTALNATSRLVEEMTDGTPYADKPTPQT